MPSKKLTTLLKTFSTPELNRFRKYLASPYFNENEEVIQLFEQIEKGIRQPKSKKDTSSLNKKQIIWQQIFNSSPYNDAKMRHLLSELIQHILRFQALQQYRKDTVQEQLALLKVVDKPDLNVHFSSVLRQLETLQEKAGLQDASYHFQQFQKEQQHYRFIEKNDRNPEMLQHLAAADFHLDCYYISQKLKHYADSIGYRNFIRADQTVSLPDNFLASVQSSPFLKEASVEVYFFIVKMFLETEEESHYFQLKNILQQKGNLFPLLELKELYTHLVNYCIDIKINAGVIKYFAELFDILKIALKRDILLEDELLPSAFYKLIVSVGIQVQEFPWTESFIQIYTPKLPPEESENALTYNLAKVYFAQQHYEKVMEQLREVEYENLTYALGGKLMLLKTYYELNEYLALDSLLDSFRVYLRRNQTISKEVRQQYMNVLRFIKKLSNVPPGDQTAITKIETQIQECKNLADKGWIVQKLEELKEDRRIGG